MTAQNDYRLDCPWCGAVTRTTQKGGKEFCNLCKRVVREDGMRNDTRTSGDGEDADEL